MNIAIGVKINAAFLEFHEISDQSGAVLEQEIVDYIKGKGLDTSKCCSQGCNGTADTNSGYSRVQARKSMRELNGEYVHCGAYSLNLTLNGCAQGILEIKCFYEVIERVYTFFGRSIKQQTMLSELASVLKLVSNITVKRLYPLCMSSRNKSVIAL